jgi:hypothetical protein
MQSVASRKTPNPALAKSLCRRGEIQSKTRDRKSSFFGHAET